MKWFTSDLHFHHKNIVRFTNRNENCNQEGHDEWLSNLWNDQVMPGDLVYHLGDFSFSTNYQEVSRLVGKLNGQKIFIKGNHDKASTFDTLKDNGDIAAWYDYKEVPLTGEKLKAVLFHFPISSWHKQSHGSLHLHGHCHGSHGFSRGKMLDVGLDSAYNIFGVHKFFSEEEVLAIMKDKAIESADLHRKANDE